MMPFNNSDSLEWFHHTGLRKMILGDRACQQNDAPGASSLLLAAQAPSITSSMDHT